MGRVGEKRNYRKEYDSYHKKPAQKKKRAVRNKAHRTLEKKTGKKLSAKAKGTTRKSQVEAGHSKRGARGTVKRQSVKSNRGWRKGKSGYK